MTAANGLNLVIDSTSRLHRPREQMGAGGDPRGSFAAALATARTGSDQQATLRDAAQKLVSSSLIQPLFDSLEKPSFGTKGPLMPGLGERRFAPLLHQHLADRMTNAAQFPLVDTIVEQFQRLTSNFTTGERGTGRST
ncbi:MAG: hypothetical protein ACYTGG_02815 [Planctomycetota bacterium]|jgi:Rod binding domain-containing protein